MFVFILEGRFDVDIEKNIGRGFLRGLYFLVYFIIYYVWSIRFYGSLDFFYRC